MSIGTIESEYSKILGKYLSIFSV